MTDPTPQALERQLELARAAYAPRAEVRERVLDKLLHGPAVAGAPPRTLAMRSDALPGSSRRWLRAAGPKVLVAVGLVGLGFAAGWQAKRAHDEPPPLPPAPRMVAQDPMVDPMLMPESSALPADEVDEAVSAPPASEPVAQLAPPGRASRASGGAEARAPRPSTPGASRARRPQAPVRLDDSSAREELVLLQRAERAVRAGNAALGLALIAELEVGYPRSKLLEERRAVELMAHCAAGATDSRSRSERFLLEQPRSIYAARIKELCSAKSTETQR
jgi:hypothetical protein